MSSEKATALVLRVVDFSETSVIVTLFTREMGKIHAMAKGARRPKGPFESALDLLSLCRVVFLRKSSDALDLLTEAKLERRFRGRGRDLSSLYSGYYVAELLSGLTDDYDPHPELFDAADATLIALAGEGSIPSQILRFELTALVLLGHMPSLSMCVHCGRRVEATGRVAFAQQGGGVLCQACRPGKTHVVNVSAGVIRALGAYADLSSRAWERLELTPTLRGELRAVVNHYLSQLLGKQPRLHRYLSGTTS